MLQDEIMDPADTEWAIITVFASKKNGSLRLCVDYRKLIAGNIPDLYSLRTMDKCIGSKTRILSTLDSRLGYLQNEVDEQYMPTMTITTHHGLSQFVRMPFGWKMHW